MSNIAITNNAANQGIINYIQSQGTIFTGYANDVSNPNFWGGVIQSCVTLGSHMGAVATAMSGLSSSTSQNTLNNLLVSLNNLITEIYGIISGTTATDFIAFVNSFDNYMLSSSGSITYPGISGKIIDIYNQICLMIQLLDSQSTFALAFNNINNHLGNSSTPIDTLHTDANALLTVTQQQNICISTLPANIQNAIYGRTITKISSTIISDLTNELNNINTLLSYFSQLNIDLANSSTSTQTIKTDAINLDSTMKTLTASLSPIQIPTGQNTFLYELQSQITNLNALCNSLVTFDNAIVNILRDPTNSLTSAIQSVQSAITSLDASISATECLDSNLIASIKSTSSSANYLKTLKSYVSNITINRSNIPQYKTCIETLMQKRQTLLNLSFSIDTIHSADKTDYENLNSIINDILNALTGTNSPVSNQSMQSLYGSQYTTLTSLQTSLSTLEQTGSISLNPSVDNKLYTQVINPLTQTLSEVIIGETSKYYASQGKTDNLTQYQTFIETLIKQRDALLNLFSSANVISDVNSDPIRSNLKTIVNNIVTAFSGVTSPLGNQPMQNTYSSQYTTFTSLQTSLSRLGAPGGTSFSASDAINNNFYTQIINPLTGALAQVIIGEASTYYASQGETIVQSNLDVLNDYNTWIQIQWSNAKASDSNRWIGNVSPYGYQYNYALYGGDYDSNYNVLPTQRNYNPLYNVTMRILLQFSSQLTLSITNLFSSNDKVINLINFSKIGQIFQQTNNTFSNIPEGNILLGIQYIGGEANSWPVSFQNPLIEQTYSIFSGNGGTNFISLMTIFTGFVSVLSTTYLNLLEASGSATQSQLAAAQTAATAAQTAAAAAQTAASAAQTTANNAQATLVSLIASIPSYGTDPLSTYLSTLNTALTALNNALLVSSNTLSALNTAAGPAQTAITAVTGYASVTTLLSNGTVFIAQLNNINATLVEPIIASYNAVNSIPNIGSTSDVITLNTALQSALGTGTNTTVAQNINTLLDAIKQLENATYGTTTLSEILSGGYSGNIKNIQDAINLLNNSSTTLTGSIGNTVQNAITTFQNGATFQSLVTAASNLNTLLTGITGSGGTASGAVTALNEAISQAQSASTSVTSIIGAIDSILPTTSETLQMNLNSLLSQIGSLQTTVNGFTTTTNPSSLQSQITSISNSLSSLVGNTSVGKQLQSAITTFQNTYITPLSSALLQITGSGGTIQGAINALNSTITQANKAETDAQTAIINASKAEADGQTAIANIAKAQTDGQTAITNASKAEADAQTGIANAAKAEADAQAAIAKNTQLQSSIDALKTASDLAVKNLQDQVSTLQNQVNYLTWVAISGIALGIIGTGIGLVAFLKSPAESSVKKLPQKEQVPTQSGKVR